MLQFVMNAQKCDAFAKIFFIFRYKSKDACKQATPFSFVKHTIGSYSQFAKSYCNYFDR